MNSRISAVMAAWAGLTLGAAQGAAQTWAPTVHQESAVQRAPLDIAAVHRRVRSRLRDPGSAQFGGLWQGRNGAACGFVNARNGFGGMSGPQPFVVPRGGRALIARMIELAGRMVADGPDQDEFVVAWNRDCAGTG